MKVDVDQFRKRVCRYCDSRLDKPFLDLGISPLANSLPLIGEESLEEFTCPLQLVKCSTCHLVQLSHVVPPKMMFSDYLYVSSTTQTFRNHFASYAKSLRSKLKKKDNALAVDIGSNDGLLLSCYQSEGMRAVGVEPAKNLSDLAAQQGLNAINDYFNAACVDQILKKYGPADIISANNVFAHIDNVQDVCKNVYQLLDGHGIFVIEFPYLITMVEKMLFDMIYHEHLSYISVSSLHYLLKQFQFKIFAIEKVSSHGGSLRIFIEKKDGSYLVSGEVAKMEEEERNNGYLTFSPYNSFAENVRQTKHALTQCVQEIKLKNKSICGYGAPAKATTLINYCGWSSSDIDYVVDDNPLKQNRLVPGAKIPIVPSSHLNDNPRDYVIIFAWNFAKEIISKTKHLEQKDTKFIIPLPHLEIV